jgi:hypothetical protein
MPAWHPMPPADAWSLHSTGSGWRNRSTGPLVKPLGSRQKASRASPIMPDSADFHAVESTTVDGRLNLVDQYLLEKSCGTLTFPIVQNIVQTFAVGAAQ